MPVLSHLLLPTQWHDMIVKVNDDDFYDDDDIANFSKSEVFDIIEEAFDEEDPKRVPPITEGAKVFWNQAIQEPKRSTQKLWQATKATAGT